MSNRAQPPRRHQTYGNHASGSDYGTSRKKVAHGFPGDSIIFEIWRERARNSEVREDWPAQGLTSVKTSVAEAGVSFCDGTGSNLSKSIVPAAVLAIVTLFVFYTLRDFGPGSAARRFHEDLMAQNYSDLQRVCTEPITDDSVTRLGVLLREIDESGASARLASMERSPNEVDVLVLYQLNGSQHPFVWVVAKKEIGWQVDPYQTLLANRA